MNLETYRNFSNLSGCARIPLLLATLCLPLRAATLETLNIQSGESRSLDLPLADPVAGALLWVRGRVVLPEGEVPGAHSLHLELNGTPLTPENTRVLNKRSVFDLPGEIVEDPNRKGRQIIESPGTVALFDAGAGGWYLKADADAFPFNLEAEPGDPYTSMGGGLPAAVSRPNLTARVLQNLGAVVSHYYEYLFELPENLVREANTLTASVRLPGRLAEHAVALSAGWMPAPDGVVTYHRPSVDEFTLVRQAPSLPDVVGPERGLHFSACPGEAEPVSVTLYTLERLENVTIGVEFLETDRPGVAGKLLDCAQAYFLAQRLSHQQSKSRLPFSRDDEPDGVAPDILIRQGDKPVAAGHPVSIPFQYYRDRKDAEKIESVLARSRELEKTPGVEILAGTSQRFLIDFTIPEDLSPGEYAGMVTLRSGEQTLRRIPLELFIRPFALADPRQKYWMWRQTWLPITEQGSIDALTMIGDTGIHGICRLAGMGIGMKVDKDTGEFLLDDTQLRAGKEILEEAGLSLNYAHDLVSGPFHWVCRYKYGIRPGNARWFGYKFLPELADTPLNPDDYNPGSRDPDDEELARLREKMPEIKKDVIALLKRMRALYDEVGLDPWIFPYDEPDGTAWAHPWVKFSAEVAHAAGFKVWSSHNDPMGWPSGIDMSVAGGLYWHVPNRIHSEPFQEGEFSPGVPVFGPMNGAIDEIRLYHRALSEEEMLAQHHAPARDSLFAYYPLEDGDGLRIRNARGVNEFDLTLSTETSVRRVQGRYGKALAFDAVHGEHDAAGLRPVLSPSEKVRSGDVPLPGEDWSISFWYRGRGTLCALPGQALRVFTSRNGPKADLRLSVPGGDAVERIVMPRERGIQPDDRFWNHVTISVNAREGRIKFYLHNEEQRQWYRENITWNYSQYRSFNPMLCRVQAGNTTWHAKALEHMTVFVFDLNYGIANLAWPEGGERMFNRPNTRWYPGLGLLAMREGIDDARYANTLFKGLKTRMDEEAAWEAVAQIYPGKEVLWRKIFFQPALAGLTYNDIRARLAREIRAFPKIAANMPDKREANPVDSGMPPTVKTR